MKEENNRAQGEGGRGRTTVTPWICKVREEVRLIYQLSANITDKRRKELRLIHLALEWYGQIPPNKARSGTDTALQTGGKHWTLIHISTAAETMAGIISLPA